MSKEEKLIERLSWIINELDCGNSKLDEEELDMALDSINKIINPKNKLSKYQACQYLNISRSTFDKWVRDGKIPKGQKEPGFKELFWEKSSLKKLKDASNK